MSGMKLDFTREQVVRHLTEEKVGQLYSQALLMPGVEAPKDRDALDSQVREARKAKARAEFDLIATQASIAKQQSARKSSYSGAMLAQMGSSGVNKSDIQTAAAFEAHIRQLNQTLAELEKEHRELDDLEKGIKSKGVKDARYFYAINVIPFNVNLSGIDVSTDLADEHKEAVTYVVANLWANLFVTVNQDAKRGLHVFKVLPDDAFDLSPTSSKKLEDFLYAAFAKRGDKIETPDDPHMIQQLLELVQAVRHLREIPSKPNAGLAAFEKRLREAKPREPERIIDDAALEGQAKDILAKVAGINGEGKYTFVRKNAGEELTDITYKDAAGEIHKLLLSQTGEREAWYEEMFTGKDLLLKFYDFEPPVSRTFKAELNAEDQIIGMTEVINPFEGVAVTETGTQVAEEFAAEPPRKGRFGGSKKA